MHYNAYFQIIIKDNGTYIKLFPPSEYGEALMLSEIRHYLNNLGIDIFSDADLAASLVEALVVQNQEREILICEEKINPVNEIAIVSVTKDLMEANVRLYPASQEGKLLSKSDIIETLQAAGIVFGIMEENLDEWLSNKRYCTDLLMAKGMLPQESRDAFIEYYFETEEGFRPTFKDDGSVDFHDLNLLNDVSQGDRLAVLIPAHRGEFGMTVLGKELPSEHPVDKSLKYGQNTILSEDGCILRASSGGYVELENEKVVVRDVYVIKGNVGTATGNVVFDGIVRIGGDVQTGYSVKATNDIMVTGVVEGATLIAGRNIVIASGVHGAGRADITAGGDITVNFIQESTITAGGDVLAGSILFSNVTANGSIIVSSNKGLVKGGVLCAKNLISVKTVGSAFATAHTQLTVGSSADDINLLKEMEVELAEKRAQQSKLHQTLNFLTRKIESNEDMEIDHQRLLRILPSMLVKGEDELNEFLNNYNRMVNNSTSGETGKIVIEGTVYEGSSIGISNASYYIQEDLASCQFVKKGKEIEVLSL
ncbi:MAG: FapA family protein [Oscillospiraceae bacterium]|nr:FapA family protein [Oscillospiraceae bacterium]